ncbi:MAG: cytochrome C oxidase subunit IV family protein [Bryobacteraceae bacterium]
MTKTSFRSEARIYGLVLLALLVLTFVTVAAAGVHFGNEVFNVAVAMGIATVKASLVALFFMHLLHDKGMNALIFVAGLSFLAVLLVLTLIDVETRLPVSPTSASASLVRNSR